jgi:hypothetical protein
VKAGGHFLFFACGYQRQRNLLIPDKRDRKSVSFSCVIGRKSTGRIFMAPAMFFMAAAVASHHCTCRSLGSFGLLLIQYFFIVTLRANCKSSNGVSHEAGTF